MASSIRPIVVLGLQNPWMIVEKKMYLKRFTIYGTLWSAEIIRSLFFENEADNVLTANGEHYRYISTQFFVC